MTERILIEPSIFKVSKPGISVLTATLDQLQFTGDQGTPPKFIKASVAGNAGGPGADTKTINYGKTFTLPPFVLGYLTGGTNTSFPGETYALKGFGGAATPYNNFAFNWTNFELAIGLSSLTTIFTNYGPPAFDYTFTALIFDYRIGF